MPSPRNEVERLCWMPTAAGPEGVAVCQLPEGHDAPCDGGEMERMIGEGFAAQVLGDRAEFADYGEAK